MTTALSTGQINFARFFTWSNRKMFIACSKRFIIILRKLIVAFTLEMHENRIKFVIKFASIRNGIPCILEYDFFQQQVTFLSNMVLLCVNYNISNLVARKPFHQGMTEVIYKFLFSSLVWKIKFCFFFQFCKISNHFKHLHN